MSHRCPGPECERVVPDSMLACAPHWYRVSTETRALVWKEFRADPLSDEHLAAIATAVEEMNRE